MNISMDVCFGKIGTETLIVNNKNSIAIRLNKQGTEIFELIYRGLTKDEIICLFQKKFNDDKERVEKDINWFCEELYSKEIIEK